MSSTTAQSKRDLTKGSIIRHVMRMAVPMAIGIGAIISFSIADTYFIGQLGATELAAISFTMPVTTLFFNILFGLAIAMSATVSRKIGAGLRDEVKMVATIGIMMAVILSSILAIMGYIFLEPVFRGLGADDTTMPFIREYMPIWLIGSVFLAVPVVANSAIRGNGDAFWPAVIMVTVAVINIILDPLLIFGLFGFPELGFKGAAVASLSAYFISMCLAMIILCVREKLFSPSYILQKSAWVFAAKALLVIAIPVSIANMIAPIVTYGYTAILSDIGNAAVAGYGIASRFEAFALIPIMALAGGIAPLVGQNFGAGNQDRLSSALRIALIFSVGYGLFCAAVFYMLAPYLAAPFSDDKNVIGVAKSYLMFVPLSYIGLNIFAVLTSMMNATAMPKQALTLNILKSFGMAMPLAYVMTNAYAIDGFIGSVIITNMVGMALCFIYMKRIRCT
jgi:putative MATE family efflux protein